MDEDRFSKLFENFRQVAFRFETLPAYKVPEETADLQAFLDGEPLPQSRDEDWLSFLKSSVRGGKRVQRVRFLPTSLTPYLRFEIEWGYLFNDEAGEDIRFLLSSNFNTNSIQSVTDFWIFDNNSVVLMDYDVEGKYLGVREITKPAEASRYLQLQGELIEASISLRQFLALYRTGQYS